jgi:hypothetical protein
MWTVYSLSVSKGDFKTSKQIWTSLRVNIIVNNLRSLTIPYDI